MLLLVAALEGQLHNSIEIEQGVAHGAKLREACSVRMRERQDDLYDGPQVA